MEGLAGDVIVRWGLAEDVIVWWVGWRCDCKVGLFDGVWVWHRYIVL